MTYKCNKCDLLGSGCPSTAFCPNCGEPLYFRTAHQMGDPKYEGTFLSAGELSAMLGGVIDIAKQTGQSVYVSDEMEVFIKHFMPHDQWDLFQTNSCLRDMSITLR